MDPERPDPERPEPPSSGGDDPTLPALERFATLVRGAPDRVPLDETALAMSAVLQPSLDVVGWLATIDDIAAACATPTRHGVLTHLCDEMAFAGDRRRYGDWRNSCLDRVIEQRRGIPITLSILVIEVARRLGVPLVGIGMPAHFLVGDPADPDWFADPFTGSELDRDGCRALLGRLTRDQVPWRDEHLAPTPNRTVAVRMLNNLRAAFTQQHDPVRLALVMRMRAVVPELAAETRAAAQAQAAFN